MKVEADYIVYTEYKSFYMCSIFYKKTACKKNTG